ncbi:MAG: ABC transporter permease [Alphaproteobacteria bacterium]|nr:ABC transporter permease [Alphaproteobacteria bacterium]
MSGGGRDLPGWLDAGLLPAVNVLLALFAGGLVVLLIGENPLHALVVLLRGAFGDLTALGYTLYYTTNFILTGLAVAVAFHAGLFNIGGEGQAYIGGLGIGLLLLALDRYLPAILLLPLGLVAAAAFGAAFAFVPAWLQAWRGSHVVITTIMFNFIASALMVYLMVNVLIAPGALNTESRGILPSGHLPQFHTIAAAFGFELPATPLNLSLLWALACCVLVYLYVWRSRWGYALRVVGHAPRAAVYAGIRPQRVTIAAMCISGALAGSVGFNEIAGVHHRLLLDFVAGYGFTGIAVALMGRNNPLGILLAALLFGTLYQGGAELAFEIPAFTREMVTVLQGFVILFSGALAYMNRPWIVRLHARLSPAREAG